MTKNASAAKPTIPTPKPNQAGHRRRPVFPGFATLDPPLGVGEVAATDVLGCGGAVGCVVVIESSVLLVVVVGGGACSVMSFAKGPKAGAVSFPNSMYEM